MVSESIRGQFVEFITLQGFDDKYIDRQEEKRILEVGVKNDISVDESLALIREIAENKGLVIERDVEDKAKAVLEEAVADGKITKKEFEEAFNVFKAACKGKVPDQEIRKRLKQMMETNEWKAGGLLGIKWYTSI
ncbi:hypothetical protein QUF74_05665 [Candidatus Halobeggiatoa sp. HSG11]|nr:hypothetical protein [Candidatus Halobeggiatoa sp. HSG11]